MDCLQGILQVVNAECREMIDQGLSGTQGLGGRNVSFLSFGGVRKGFAPGDMYLNDHTFSKIED